MSVPRLRPRSQSRFANASAPAEVADLARLLPLWPHELADASRAGCARRCEVLQRALRQERQRGIAGHWTYDLGRHAALRRHYERELAALKSLNRLQRVSPSAPCLATIRRDLEQV